MTSARKQEAHLGWMHTLLELVHYRIVHFTISISHSLRSICPIFILVLHRVQLLHVRLLHVLLNENPHLANIKSERRTAQADWTPMRSYIGWGDRNEATLKPYHGAKGLRTESKFQFSHLRVILLQLILQLSVLCGRLERVTWLAPLQWQPL